MVMCAWLLSSCALKDSLLGNGDANGFKHELTVNGATSLRKELEAELAAQRKYNRKLQQFSSRRKIAMLESELLTKKLRSEGYYGSQVSHNIHQNTIHLTVETGPIYRINTFDITWAEPSLDTSQLPVNLKSGDPLRAVDVIAQRTTLTRYLSSHACLYVVNVESDIKVYHDTRSADLVFNIADSPTVRIGEILIEGTTTIEPDYLRQRVAIEDGDCFRRQQIDQVRLDLLQTNLISSVSTHIGEPKDGEINVTFEVTERRHKTFSAGIVYETDEGTGLALGWEHRNLFGRAEKLTIDTLVSENSYHIDSSITLPHFRKPNQILRLSAGVEQESTDAFESDVGSLMAEISRQLTPSLRGSVATQLDFSHITEIDQKNNFALFSIPLSLEMDKRNDPLDPTKGWIISLKSTPYIDTYDEKTRFLKSIVSTSAYISRASLPLRPTLALRTALGSITGIERKGVPANIRFYIGGGGSVRGYAYQTLGPLVEGEPQGGMSFHESSIETRLRFGENWGAVLFMDGGMAYLKERPEVSEKFLWAAGFGIRYYTSFAPIRFDMAFPLDKREQIDDDFQLYISIGQAF